MMKEREREKERKRGKEERARSARWSRLCEAATTLWFPPSLFCSPPSPSLFFFFFLAILFLSHRLNENRAREAGALLHSP